MGWGGANGTPPDEDCAATAMVMVNHLTGKSTVLTWADYQFGNDLDARDFSQTAYDGRVDPVRTLLRIRPFQTKNPSRTVPRTSR